MSYLNQQALKKMGFSQLGVNVRISEKVSFYAPELIKIGDNCRIDDFCVLSGKITLGRNIHISTSCNIFGGDRGIIIGDFCALSFGCCLFTKTDDYSGETLTNPTVPEKYKNIAELPIVIKRHSIIGARSVIFPGVVLEEGTAAGAMSLFTKSTEEWGIYFGIPAKRQKSRKKNLLNLEKLYLEECKNYDLNDSNNK